MESIDYKMDVLSISKKRKTSEKTLPMVTQMVTQMVTNLKKRKLDSDSDSDFKPTSESGSSVIDTTGDEYENDSFIDDEKYDYTPIIIRTNKRKNNDETTPSGPPKKTKKPMRRIKPIIVKKKVCAPFDHFEIDKTVDLETISGLIEVIDSWEAYKTLHNIDFDNLLSVFENDGFVKTFHDKHIKYNKLTKIKQELIQVNNLIGMKSFKVQLCHQIIFFIQDINSDEMMHTILFGDPGTGKTTVGKILASIYSKLGFLSKGTFKLASREDFVDKYLGHTAIKTKNLLESCVGGVLFIDEAYSLGSGNNDKDSFAKEAVDTLNRFLSENTKDFICIIAGYKASLKSDFFSQNPGLERRFPWRFHMDNYTNEDLYNIFCCIEDNKFVIAVNDTCKIMKLFDTKIFKNNGGDCQNIFDRCKISVGLRNFKNEVTKTADNKFKIEDIDIIAGVNSFKSSTFSKNKGGSVPIGMYA